MKVHRFANILCSDGYRRRSCLMAYFACLAISSMSCSTIDARTPSLMESPISGDPFAWLGEISDPHALDWAYAQTARSVKMLSSDPEYMPRYEAALEVLEHKARIEDRDITLQGSWIYNIWQDERHPRGIWRRTKLQSFQTGAPEWQLLLDIDDLARKEARAWQFRRAECFGQRCLVFLSEGGQPATSMREFDLEELTFVRGGFELPEESAVSAVWQNEDTLLVASTHEAGVATSRGMPLTVRLWTRGGSLATAKEIYRGDATDVGVWLLTLGSDDDQRIVLVQRREANGDISYEKLDGSSSPARLSVPPRAALLGVFRGEMVFRVLRGGWETTHGTWLEGSILSIPVKDIKRADPTVRVVASADRGDQIKDAKLTSHGLLASTLDRGRMRLWRFALKGTRWRREEIEFPTDGTTVITLGSPAVSTAFVVHQGFLEPPALYAIEVGERRAAKLRSLPAQFDATRYVVKQLEATSQDGTKVPYFLVQSRDLRPEANTPTVIHAYGASGAVELPTYDGILGRLWLSRGGAYVLANIRGGGELGVKWHVTKTERRHTYDDFIAVAEDLIRRKITAPRHVGIRGHSYGGLLVGVVLNERPDLFHAAVLENPVLDLIGAEELRNGVRVRSAQDALYKAEIGSLEVPEERVFMEQTSPYQNLEAREAFPIPFISTSTTDVYVSPGMARKYAARLASMSMPFFFYENPEGGHAAWSTPPQRARYEALVYTYLWDRLH